MIEDEDHGTPANKASRAPSPFPVSEAEVTPSSLSAAEQVEGSLPTDAGTPGAASSSASTTELGETSSPSAGSYETIDATAPDAQTNSTALQREPTRSNALTAVVGLVLVLLLAAVAYLFYAQQNTQADSASLSDLTKRLATLEQRPTPAPADLGGLTARLDEMARGVTALKGTVAGLESRVAAVEGKATQAGPTPADTSALDGKVGTLEGKTGDLGRELDQLKTTVADLPKPPDLAPVEARLGDLDTRLAALAKTVDTLPRVDLTPVTARLDTLEGRLKPIETQVKAAAAPERVAQTRAAPLAVTAESIRRSIDAGRPFQGDVDALRRLGAEPSLIEPLQSLAANGAPTLTDLRADLAGLRDRILVDSTPAPSGSYLDRIVSGARNLVRVRPLGTVVGDTPAAVLTRIDDDIARDDLAAALAEWEKLPDAAKDVSKGLADRLRLRLNAETAARTIGTNAIQAMAATRQ